MLLLGAGWLGCLPALWAGDPGAPWIDGVGTGLRRHSHALGVVAGVGWGGSQWGSRQPHDLAWLGARYSWIVSDVLAADSWWRGNVELAGELFGGGQFSPSGRYLCGMTPFLVYNFATGTPWMPFIGAGAGVTLTNIGEPDLSTRFQFNDQLVLGTHYFFDERVATTFQYRFVHLSNAGIREPNNGVNTHMVFAGVTWFY